MEESFAYLKEFAEREDHCRVPTRHKTADGYRPGGWINDQRANKDKIDSDRRQRLESLPGWTWNIGK
jgi:hypothetical protein